jgi:hypothetical protein
MAVSSRGNQWFFGIAATVNSLKTKVLVALTILEVGRLVLELLLIGFQVRIEDIPLLTNVTHGVCKDSGGVDHHCALFGGLYHGLPGDLLRAFWAGIFDDLGGHGSHLTSEAERSRGGAVDGDGKGTGHQLESLFDGARSPSRKGAVGILGVVVGHDGVEAEVSVISSPAGDADPVD